MKSFLLWLATLMLAMDTVNSILEVCKVNVDIIFLLDTSGSMSNADFDHEKSFASRVVEHFEVGPTDAQFGVLTFDTSVENIFKLSEYSDKDSIIKKISTIPHRKGLTKTYLALDYIKNNNLFSTAQGGRDSSTKLVVVITDGVSDNTTRTAIAAQELRQLGYKLISVGIGLSSDEELMNIGGSASNVFKPNSFKVLTNYEDLVSKRICKILEPPVPVPQVEMCKDKVVDIFFLLDSSGSISYTDFDLIKSFVIRVVEHFKVGPTDAQFGVLTYDTSVEMIFKLSDYFDNDSVIKKISTIRHRRGLTKTYLALDYIKNNNLFTTAQGARDSSTKLVVVITDGWSDNTTRTAKAAQELRQLGYTLIAMGIALSSDEELFNIVGSFSNIYKPVSFKALNNYEHVLPKRLCEIPVPPVPVPSEKVCKAIVDIFFVLDTSGSISYTDFDRQRSFATRLVEHFQVGPADAQFGALTFDTTVEVIFKLSEYSDKDSVIKKIFTIPHRRGSTKTYLALDYIKNNNLFSTAQGGRDSSTKLVVVITDGFSDNTTRTATAAQELRQLGYKLIAIYIGYGTSGELVSIGGSASNVFKATNYVTLSGIEDKVSTRLCEIPVSEGNVPPTPSKKCGEGFVPDPKDPNACLDDDECSRTNECQQICVNQIGTYRCTCQDDYVVDTNDTTKCKKIAECPAPVDIVLLIDASGSIGEDYFKIQEAFISRFIKRFSFGQNGALWAAVLFSFKAEELFKLNSFTDRDNIIKALKDAPYLTGSTMTHKAINHIIENDIFSSINGGRANAPDTVIIITDGQSSRREMTTQAVANLKNLGVKVISLGIGDQVDEFELSGMASSGDDVIIVDNFESLDYVEESLLKRACPLYRG